MRYLTDEEFETACAIHEQYGKDLSSLFLAILDTANTGDPLSCQESRIKILKPYLKEHGIVLVPKDGAFIVHRECKAA